MLRKVVLPLLAILMVATLAACASESTQAPAAEPAVVEQPTAEPTAAPEAEEVATEEPAAEAAAAEAAAAEPTVAPTEESAAEAAPADEAETAVYTVDTAASTVEWFGSKPVGPSESGTVQISNGQMTFAGDQLVEGSMVIDMTTIETTSQSGGMAEQLVGHLTSDDFFGVATYPTATLVIKSATPTGTENQYTVTADLTIKATTKEIEFVTDVVVGEGTLTATSVIIVNRADFDVRYGSGSFFSNLGNDLISDDMEITVTLVANQG